MTAPIRASERARAERWPPAAAASSGGRLERHPRTLPSLRVLARLQQIAERRAALLATEGFEEEHALPERLAQEFQRRAAASLRPRD